MPRRRPLSRVGTLTAITAIAFTGAPTAAAEEPAAPSISEIHYDNTGTDTGEAIEVEAPVGFDLTGWRLALYNGNGGSVYDNRTLSGTVPDAGVVVETYPTNGIQNGSPDGVALIAPDGTVAEFLSYEGTMTAGGVTATDIGVSEASDTPAGHSLQKVDGVWQAPAPHSFGARNTGGEDPGPDPEPVDCDVPVTHTIAEVQGTGDASPLVGDQVVVEGVVTADHRTGGYNGVYVQTEGSGDRAPAAGTASDAVFVYLTTNSANHPDVAVGDQVRVRGTVGEYFGLTQVTIGARTDVQVCANDAPLPAAAPLELPLDAAARESVESMVVAPVGPYTVSEVYNTNRYGEVVLTAGTEAARIPTDLHRPGTPEARAVAEANALGRLLVDDGRTTNLSEAGQAPPYVYPDAPLRVGDQVEAFGPTVLSYGFDEWRLQPTTPVNADTPAIDRTTFKSTNPRTPAPEDVGGDIQVASFNVLNYFVHFGGEARGADDEAGLARQEAKIVSAITALGAEVVALEEIENSVKFNAEDPQQALKRLVEALNAAEGAGTWDYVRSPASLPGADAQDVITTAIIFKPGAVTPVGESRSIDDESVWFNAREPIAQEFTASDVTFTVVANHFKSKSASGDPTGDNADSGDGQGAYNGDRTRQARSLVSFVAGLENVLLLGDFNAYTQEDPMRVLYEASFQDLNDTGESSYVFAGESGSLDHAVASPALAERVTGVDVWQINSHESYAFQYDGHPAFYSADPYRASDHNPIVVGLSTEAAGPVELDLLSVNDFHGRLESPASDENDNPIGGAAQLAGLVEQQRQANPNTLFLSAGDNIGASTFVSAIDDDNPTLDALNLMELDASAVGNHEFDRGMDDLTGRVTDRADFPYLGANVYRGDERALAPYVVREVDGVGVGVVGVVTEQTASLVSPDGIAGITFRDPVAEAELVAGQLKDGDEANGEADVVVLLAHEGAATENIDSVEELRADPVFGEFVDLSANVDVIFSGHTHQPYAFTAPIPGTDRLRPVIQAEDYGTRLGKATLTVDPASGEIVNTGAELLDVVGVPEDQEVAQLVADAIANAEVLGQEPLGEITADITRAFTEDGTEDRGSESVLGNFVADVQLAGTAEEGRGGAQIAFMNPGGLRADLTYAPDGVVTYAEAFAVQPFANDVVTKTYTGAQIKQVLEEQWQPEGASRPKLHLGVSKGFTYTYLPDNPTGERITSMSLNGEPIDLDGTYRVTVNSFLAAGGDNFVTLGEGTDQATTGNNDLTMLTEYLGANSPVTADPEPRATVGDPRPEPECTETITGLRLWKVDVRAGETCLDDAVVLGSVRVHDGASLTATDGMVLGTLTATTPERVTVSGTRVLGLVTVAGATGEVVVENASVTGTLTLLGNRSGVRLDGNRVTGPVSLVDNTGGEHVVSANRITGSLYCVRNDPPPTDADAPNRIRGAAIGQCRRL
ncbi:ExeM/NucH family extracellular endonuclease [Actinophytocola gossypii]|uniref:ExeM/NucH family extracellular endonuclease n=1 Tax=Actinophytocola gossypii TaxID=2812003 RepID=A0ABT2J547_9PSEU|nr:ExeM/NucH family extracellular endonuclease [Actinophytocola gossypii]MCT2582384.1 ExeM/NucH family extracellular endonuclease [Actinophytocola gossypii]